MSRNKNNLIIITTNYINFSSLKPKNELEKEKTSLFNNNKKLELLETSNKLSEFKNSNGFEIANISNLQNHIHKIKGSSIYGYFCLTTDPDSNKGYLDAIVENIFQNEKINFGNLHAEIKRMYLIIHGKDFKIDEGSLLRELSPNEIQNRLLINNPGIVAQLYKNGLLSIFIFTHAGTDEMGQLISDFNWEKYGNEVEKLIIEKLEKASRNTKLLLIWEKVSINLNCPDFKNFHNLDLSLQEIIFQRIEKALKTTTLDQDDLLIREVKVDLQKEVNGQDIKNFNIAQFMESIDSYFQQKMGLISK